MNIRAVIFNSGAAKRAAQVLDALNINEGDTIADIGSGGGFFTFEFAKRTGPSGTIFAVDADKKLLAYVKKQIKKRGEANINAVEARQEDANLPSACCDLIFMRSVFHHIPGPASYFSRLKGSLKQNGRLALIDWKPGASHKGHGTAEETLIGVMSCAGYERIASFDFLERQSFNIFRVKNGSMKG